MAKKMKEVSYHRKQPKNANIIDDLAEIAKRCDEKVIDGLIHVTGFKVSEIEEAFTALGWEHEIDFNGFQWDFWLYLKKGDRVTVASGCGYWGTSYQINEKD